MSGLPSEEDMNTLLGISRALHASSLDSTTEELPQVECRMTKEEYIRKQNRLFEELTGKSREERISDPQTSRELTDMLELYMASMDEQVFNEAQLQEQVLTRMEQVSKSQLAAVLDLQDETDKYAYVIDKVSRLQAQVTLLEADYTELSEQRQELDFSRLELKHKYATELAKRVRAEHMVKVLGQKVIELDQKLTESEAAKQDTQNQLQHMNVYKEAKPDSNNSAKLPSELDLNEKLDLLYTEILKLQKTENRDIPSTPEKLLAKILVYVENTRSRKAQHVRELVNAFMDAYEARERQLTAALEKSQTDAQVYLARCTQLEKQATDKSQEIQGLIDRSVSLILTDKQLRSQLVSTADILKRYEQVIDTSRNHIDQLTRENQSLLSENEELFEQLRKSSS